MITLTTIPNISHSDWLTQLQRFTKGNTSLIMEALPLNIENSKKAEITLKLLQPLIYGFKAEVQYIQTYSNTVRVKQPDNKSEEVEQISKKVLLKYIEKVPFNSIDAIFKQVDAMIPESVTGLERQKQQILIAIKAQVVQKFTFNGLGMDDYTTKIE